MCVLVVRFVFLFSRFHACLCRRFGLASSALVLCSSCRRCVPPLSMPSYGPCVPARLFSVFSVCLWGLFRHDVALRLFFRTSSSKYRVVDTGTPDQHRQTNRHCPAMHNGAAERELAPNNGQQWLLPSGYSLVPYGTWDRRFANILAPKVGLVQRPKMDSGRSETFRDTNTTLFASLTILARSRSSSPLSVNAACGPWWLQVHGGSARSEGHPSSH